MNHSQPINSFKGQEVCRDADWVDVLKFFFFNYGLHALTVLTSPGAGMLETITTTLVALVLPYTGAFRAIIAIYRLACTEPTALDTAHKAGALCLVFPEVEQEWDSFKQHTVNPALTTVHGQHPVNPEMSWRHDSGKNHHIKLVRVPRHFKVTPVITPDEANPNAHKTEIAANYSIPKTVIAIAQVWYGSLELWRGFNRLGMKYGYATHTLTVVPYVILSLVNFLANLCQPQYPAMFLVEYDANRPPVTAPGSSLPAMPDRRISGFVGKAVYQNVPGGKVNKGLLLEGETRRKAGRWGIEWSMRIVSCALVILVIGGPYGFMLYLTRFEKRKSTTSQRAWLMSWLVVGQVLGAVSPRGVPAFYRVSIPFICAVLLCAPAVGGFITVAKMILKEKICITV